MYILINKTIVMNVKKIVNKTLILSEDIGFTNKDGSYKKEILLLLLLMKTTGVYELKNKSDIWLLAYRLYVIYGAQLSFDELLINELFFAILYEKFEEGEDFNSFALEVYENGIVAAINTVDLENFYGLRVKNKNNVTDKIFEKKLILKAQPYWLLKEENIFIFPFTIRDIELREKLLKGKNVGKKIKKQAVKWADLVTKYLKNER